MSTVYLHIGTQKTGTTALQSFLRENEKVLEQQGYCYPFMNLHIANGYNDRNGHFLVYKSALKDAEGKKKDERKVREKGYRIIEKLGKKFPNIILSDEIIWHKSRKEEGFWEDIIENFRKVNCEVKVIVYFRRQDLMVQSLWNQSIKGINRISKTFLECMETDYFSYYPLDYYQYLKEISEHVKKENIIVRIYESEQFEGETNSIYSDFLHHIGLVHTSDYTNTNILPNYGIAGNFTEFKRLTNGLPEYQAVSNFLRQPISLASDWCAKEGNHAAVSMFEYEDQLAYLESFQESNEKVAREYLGREDGRLFFEKVQELPKWELQQEELYKNLLLYVGEGFIRQEEKIIALQEEIKAIESHSLFLYHGLIFRVCRKLWNILRKA